MIKLGTLLLGIWLCLSGSLSGQVIQDTEEDEVFDRGMQIELINLGTRGLGIINLALIRKKATFQFNYGVRVGTLRDSRETRIESAFLDQGTRYVYGKLNSLFLVTPYIGVEKPLFSRENHPHNLVQLSVGGQVGPAFGLVRPYYLEIYQQLARGLGAREIMAYDPEQHSYYDIIGVAGFLSSPWDLSLQPGISVRTYATLNFAENPRYITSLEFGLNADYFLDGVPLMVDVNPQQLFLGATIGLVIGGRW